MDQRNFVYMFYGFLAAWLVLIAYIVSMVTRERKIHRDIEVLKRMVEDREKRG